jgi:superfamily I DNA/RNA helicase
MTWKEDLETNSPAFELAASNHKTIRAVAGPGTGKSFAIKKRVLRLLEEGVEPSKILAITFTRAAARDLKNEITSLGVQGAESVHSSTLHSHALSILMKEGVLEYTERVPRMVIEHEQKPLIIDLDKSQYGGIRDKKKLLGAYLAAWARLQSDEPGFEKNPIEQHFKTDLVNWFKIHKGILVGEVIPIVIEYLRNNPKSQFIGEYEYILVDEYQDLNKSEQEFIRLLRGDADLVIVGDDDQSIYSFKHAHPQGIQNIEELFGEYKDIAFDVCRRCPKIVTQMASRLIAQNPNRTLGDLNSFDKNPDGVVDIVQWDDLESEIEGITNFITEQLKHSLYRPEDILVLTPRRRIGYRIRARLLTRRIRVKSYFRESIIESSKVQRAFSLLNYLANPEDKISLRFLLGFGSNDFRRKQYKILLGYSEDNKKSIENVLEDCIAEEIKLKGISTILPEYIKIKSDLNDMKSAIMTNPAEGFFDFFCDSQEDEEDFFEIGQIYEQAISEVGVEELTNEEDFAEWIKKVMSIVLELVAIPDAPDVNDHVRIMSLHSSKGLSAKLVIITSMIDQLMPFLPTGSNIEERNQHIEEQRRLFYVAVTRCKATKDQDGRLVISSFLNIHGNDALMLNIPAKAGSIHKTRSTRFLTDFGPIAPRAKSGEDI